MKLCIRMWIIFFILVITPIQSECKEDFCTPCYSLLTGDGILLTYRNHMRSILINHASLNGKKYNFLMVRLPSFENEWLVAIHGSRENGYVVISLTPDKSIYSQVVKNNKNEDRKLSNGYEYDFGKDMIIEEHEKPIDSNAAEQITEICQKLISKTRLYEKNDTKTLDGTRYILSSARGICAAVVSPENTSNIGNLVSLGESLYKYTLSNSKEKDVLELQINILSKELANNLK